MSTLAIFLIIIFTLLFLIMIVSIYQNHNVYDDCSDETITTTTTTTHYDTGTPQYATVGSLTRQWENGQPFVVDPQDHDKVYVNTNDDMYEDGAGRIWSLI